MNFAFAVRRGRSRETGAWEIVLKFEAADGASHSYPLTEERVKDLAAKLEDELTIMRSVKPTSSG